MTNPVDPPLVMNLPPAPLVTDSPEVFDDKSFPFAEALDPWGQSLNALGMSAKTNAVAAKEGAVEAKSAAQASQNSAVSAATAGNASRWEAARVYAEGEAVWSPTDFQTYRSRVGGASATDPAQDAVRWAVLGPSLAQLHAAALYF